MDYCEGAIHTSHLSLEGSRDGCTISDLLPFAYMPLLADRLSFLRLGRVNVPRSCTTKDNFVYKSAIKATDQTWFTYIMDSTFSDDDRRGESVFLIAVD